MKDTYKEYRVTLTPPGTDESQHWNVIAVQFIVRAPDALSAINTALGVLEEWTPTKAAENTSSVAGVTAKAHK